MRVYVDLVLGLNIFFDFFLLLTTALILKRRVRIRRIWLGGCVGGMTTFLLFISLNNILLLVVKVLFSILMVLSTFSYHDFKYFINNLIYLYLSSIVLGGGLYLLDIEVNFRNEGLMFYRNHYFSILVVIAVALIILFLYYKQMGELKNNYNNYVKVKIFYGDKEFNYIGYVDSGNKLVDQYKRRPISLIYSDDFKYKDEDILLVPYETASGTGILKCLVVDRMVVGKRNYPKSLIGFMKEKIKIDGVDVILNNKLGG